MKTNAAAVQLSSSNLKDLLQHAFCSDGEAHFFELWAAVAVLLVSPVDVTGG